MQLNQSSSNQRWEHNVRGLSVKMYWYILYLFLKKVQVKWNGSKPKLTGYKEDFHLKYWKLIIFDSWLRIKVKNHTDMSKILGMI